VAAARTRVIGVDVGGTFTDLIQLDERSGEVVVAKVPSTPDNQAYGVMAAAHSVAEDLATVRAVVHGTTVTTNAVLEGKIARCGIICTAGFRDVLELGRRTRPESYGMAFKVEPLIPRTLRVEANERINAHGEVLTPLDEASVERAARELLSRCCEALVIFFLHSYANPSHERRAGEIARAIWPNAYVTLSSDVIKEYREFERATAATMNAAVQPILERYLSRLQQELGGKGYTDDLLVMQGNGGLNSSRIVVEGAASTILSGPAAGISASAYIAKASASERLITCDMGGTSCDIGVVQGGVPEVTLEKSLGFNRPIHVPMIDVHTIGAGGGSIAYLDEGGSLQVGPESAGAKPGPICYGRGGTRVTLTDANVVLGRLDGRRLLGVAQPVAPAVVRRAVEDQLRMPAVEGAAAAIRIADDRMASAIRMVSLRRGLDPRDFALFPFGGAGPLHAVALARELNVPRLLVPLRPGIINALGCLVADVRHDFIDTIGKRMKEVTSTDIRGTLEKHIARGKELLGRGRVEIEGTRFTHRAHMKFEGQTHVIVVEVPGVDMTPVQLGEDFEKAYWNRFAVELKEMRPVLVELQTTVFGKRAPVKLEALLALKSGSSLAGAVCGERDVWFERGGWQKTRIYRRDRLCTGLRFAGPAVVEQMDATTLIEPDCQVEVDDLGNLRVTV
jgi:N-methylhydantoinase A